MVALEDVFKERMALSNAFVFRRSTARRTIQYRVIDSGNRVVDEVALEYIQGVTLLEGSRGVIYVRTKHAKRSLNEKL
jgi:superfamily II DNA helicase RecQ